MHQPRNTGSATGVHHALRTTHIHTVQFGALTRFDGDLGGKVVNTLHALHQAQQSGWVRDAALAALDG
jgi:hypothetical protein